MLSGTSRQQRKAIPERYRPAAYYEDYIVGATLANLSMLGICREQLFRQEMIPLFLSATTLEYELSHTIFPTLVQVLTAGASRGTGIA